MSCRPFLLILSGFLSCGWLCQLVPAQVPPTKNPPVARPRISPQSDGREWIKTPPEGAFPDDETRAVEATAIYEVVASKNTVAIVRDLKDQSHVKLTPDDAAYYTGHYFRCPQGKTPYLVRAVFGHGGTGRYFVKRFGRKLLIEHGSLGHSDVANKSALVIHLEVEPEAVYTMALIAE